jgi:hypothetical protein
LFGQNKSPIPVLQNLAGPNYIIGDTCTGSVQIGTNSNYCTYLWMPNTGLSDPTIAMPIACPKQTTTYVLYVTDQDGNAYRDSVTVSLAVISSRLFRPLVLGGQEVFGEKGVMTFENLDNDDKDANFDNSDSYVEGGDNELVPWIITIKSTEINKIYIAADKGGEFVKIWTTSTKKNGTEYVIDTATNKGSIISLPKINNDYSDTFWIEGVRAHKNQYDTRLMAIIAADPNTVVDPFYHHDRTLQTFTIVGIQEIFWSGKGNGFDVDRSNLPIHTSDDLDEDIINFIPPITQPNLRSYRVFPDKRFVSLKESDKRRNIVYANIQLTPAPIEDIRIFVKTFDIDDPFSEPGITTANPEYFIDPNDLGKVGTYQGAENIIDNFDVHREKGFAKYDLNNDNRGIALLHQDDSTHYATQNKAGIFLKKKNNTFDVLNIGGDSASVIMKSGERNLQLGFVTSRQPGDNYRIVANMDSSCLYRLRNEDKYDKLDIVDPFTKKLIEKPSNYASDVLTIWRILHVENDAMDVSNADSLNRVTVFITDFTGTKASHAEKLSLSSNPQNYIEDTQDNTVNLSTSKDNGRFENGSLKIGHNSTTAYTISSKGVGSIIKGNENTKLINKIGKTFNLVGTVATGNMSFIIKQNTGGNLAGTVAEITKNGNSFEWTLVGVNLANISIGDMLHIAGHEEGVQIINIIGTKLQTKDLLIPVLLDDDDDYTMNNSNLIDLSFTARTYEKVYLLVEEMTPPPNSGLTKEDINNTNLPFKQNASTFNSDEPIYYTNTLKKNHVENSINFSLESRDFWKVNVAKVWQSEYIWDNDFDNEPNGLKGITFYEPGYDDRIYSGTHYCMVFQEQIREFYQNNTARQESITAAHEIGHQFGLNHGLDFKNKGGAYTIAYAIPEGGCTNGVGITKAALDACMANGQMQLMVGGTNLLTPADLINRHKNYIRSRFESPGGFYTNRHF